MVASFDSVPLVRGEVSQCDEPSTSKSDYHVRQQQSEAVKLDQLRADDDMAASAYVGNNIGTKTKTKSVVAWKMETEHLINVKAAKVAEALEAMK